MDLALPESVEDLEALACELRCVLDAVASGELDGGATLERLVVGLLDDVEGETLSRDRAPSRR